MKEMLVEHVLRDTIIIGLASDKIRAKIVKEGHTSQTELSYGDSKAGSFHTTAFGQNAGDCKSELCPVWKIHKK